MSLDMVRVKKFRDENKITSKGRLAIMLQLTRRFRGMELPIDPDSLLTKSNGQIRGLSGANCQKILAEHGITRQLSSEAGRTTRSGLGWVKIYTALINEMRPTSEEMDEVELFWIGCVREFFASQPFKLDADKSLSVSTAIDDLFDQVVKRQKEQPGSTLLGTVLQQLVAAKLSIIVPGLSINSASAADGPTGRDGDFNVGDTAIHCTTAPGELLMGKCSANISAGLHPIIITVRDRVKNAWDMASDMGFAEGLEVWDIQSFLSTNVQEHGQFSDASRRDMLHRIIDRYNEIIDSYETDPGLKILYEG